MVRFGHHTKGGTGGMGGGGRFNDTSSYMTDTSSITNPVELGYISYSNDDNEGAADEEDVSSFFDSNTSTLTGLTGWTEGENFPMAHSKSYEMESNRQLSSISFDLNGSIETSLEGGGRMGANAGPLNAAGKAVHFRSEVKGPAGSPTSSVVSGGSNGSKKRAPVPPLRDPTMDDSEEDQNWEEDCNYDINPTLMFLVLESHDWKEAISLLDGKGLENKNDMWNLGVLFGGKKREADAEIAKKRKDELKVQARTWITRRERNGVLRWRMLPLHAALAFNAPFEVVLHLYHLYPGAVRCRNDQGMLPLHHCFMYGNEDKILELFLDVFPEALTVVDDKGRSPLGCTPKDGSDNERRSNIIALYSNFQVELAKKEATKRDGGAAANDAAEEDTDSPIEEGTLGAAPRYTTNMDYNQASYKSIKGLIPSKKKQAAAPTTTTAPLSPKEEAISDRYARLNSEDGENIPLNGGRIGGLSTIHEGEEDESLARRVLRSELLELRETRKKKGLRKILGKMKVDKHNFN